MYVFESTDPAKSAAMSAAKPKPVAKQAVEGGKKIVTGMVSTVTKLLKNTNSPRNSRSVNPGKELTGQKLVAVKEFLSLFRIKRDELRSEIAELNEILSQ